MNNVGRPREEEKRVIALALARNGVHASEIARMVSLHRNTVNKWFQEPDFQEVITQAEVASANYLPARQIVINSYQELEAKHERENAHMLERQRRDTELWARICAITALLFQNANNFTEQDLERLVEIVSKNERTTIRKS